MYNYVNWDMFHSFCLIEKEGDKDVSGTCESDMPIINRVSL